MQNPNSSDELSIKTGTLWKDHPIELFQLIENFIQSNHWSIRSQRLYILGPQEVAWEHRIAPWWGSHSLCRRWSTWWGCAECGPAADNSWWRERHGPIPSPPYPHQAHGIGTLNGDRKIVQWKHRGCWCLGGGTEAIPHEANLSLLALITLALYKNGKWSWACPSLVSLLQLPIASVL